MPFFKKKNIIGYILPMTTKTEKDKALNFIIRAVIGQSKAASLQKAGLLAAAFLTI